MCLSKNKISELPDNAMLKVCPDLWHAWDFEKNNELGIDICKMTKGMKRVAWWICPECNSSYQSIIINKVKGYGCPYCAGRQVNHTNSLASLNPKLASEWHPTKNDELTPHDVTRGQKEKFWWVCDECNHDYDSTIYNRLNNHGCPYCSGRKINKEDSIAILYPILLDEWDFKKNGEIGLDVYKISRCSNQKAWWNCKQCQGSWDAAVATRTKGHGCPYCMGQKPTIESCLFKTNPKLSSEWHPILNGELTPHDVLPHTNQKVWWMGECGHEWETSVGGRSEGQGCVYCSGQKVLIGFNDMWTTAPEIANMLLNPEDGYKYTKGSGVFVFWKCPDCDSKLEKEIKNVSTNGLRCKMCSDGVSFPEKFMRNLLTFIAIDFTPEIRFSWSDNKVYDFYIPSLNLIIETHGKQHYDKGFEQLGGRSLEEEQANDKYKYELAIANGILPESYIVIDCRKSDFEFIKTNILNSRLAEIFDLSNVNWNEIAKNSESSLVVHCWELFNYGHSTDEIMKRLNIGRNTVIDYLKRGNALQVINYTKTLTKCIVQLNKEYILLNSFQSIIEASNKTGVAYKTIHRALRANFNAGKLGYKWMYLEDYEKHVTNN